MSKPKIIRTGLALGDIECAFSNWRFAIRLAQADEEGKAQWMKHCNTAQERVKAWTDQVVADAEEARTKAHEALIALRELYQAKGADEVLDARAKAAKVLGIDD